LCYGGCVKALNKVKNTNKGERLIQPEQDIANGEVLDIIKQYENDLGDYIFYVAEK